MPESLDSDRSFDRTDQWTVDRVYGTLAAADRLLAALDIDYTIIGGTMLGAVRHRGLIPWDDDGDIGIAETDLPKIDAEAREFLRPMGYGISRATNWHQLYTVFPLDGRRIKPEHNFRYPFTDLFPMKRYSDGRITFSERRARESWPTQFFTAEEFTTRTRHEFGPLRLRGVTQPAADRYLDDAYGTDWRSAAYRIFDHATWEFHDPAPVRLETTDCALPSGILSA